jgi:hypothetical protein
MAAAAEMLADFGVEPIMADASRALHERLAAEEEERPARPGGPSVDLGAENYATALITARKA